MTTYYYISETVDTESRARIRMRLRDGAKVSLYGVTELKILPQYWDNKAHRIKPRAEFKGMAELRTKLNDLKTYIEDRYDEDRAAGKIDRDKKKDKKWLAEEIDRYHHPEKYATQGPKNLLEFIRAFIDKPPADVCYKQTREYERTLHYLEGFAREKNRSVDFKDMDLDFYEDWILFMQEKNLAKNTIGKKVQTLKIFLNYATEKEMPVNPQYKSRRFKTISEESESIYLNAMELDQLYKLDLSERPGLERVRDQFLIGCWTGCRFGDLPQVTRGNIKDNIIHITQGKTGNKVPIPVHPVVREILEKYEGVLPPTISNQKFNDALKDIAKMAKLNEPFHKRITKGGITRSTQYKKWEMVASHTARRSFATNLYKSGFPAISIMQITGHKTESSFLKYIKVTPEEHAKMLQEHWQQQATASLKAV